ncbi:reverse transcriptase [Cordyceps javanica]|uniref:Reverse transcriptase n=1 Tax=Cordyceps javanica TaxID=43265 RepID=A0A545UKM1_9HYPO|nr:reverse transcriptase [Cordyceps javanica]
MRAKPHNGAWRCRAVTEDRSNPQRMRVVCRNESEQDMVKKTIEEKLPVARVLDDGYHRIRVDGVPRTVMPDEEGNDLPGVAALLSTANDSEVSKASWLRDRKLLKLDDFWMRDSSMWAMSRQQQRLSTAPARSNATTAKSLPAIERRTARNHESALGAPRKAIIIGIAPKSLPSVYPAVVRTNRSAKSAGCSIPLGMSNTLRIIQLNVHKRGEIHDSLMNDEEIADAAVVAIQEPQARLIHGRLLTTPMTHHKWTKLVPTICNTAGRWAIRSMMWVRRNLEVEQVAIESSDLTAAVITLPERKVLVVSVYVQGVDKQALTDACALLRDTIMKTRRDEGQIVDVVLVGDFNRHDHLWGGEDVSLIRQGEADEIVDLMSDYILNSLLPRGTKTWQGGEHESTVDVVLVSEGLAQNLVSCRACSKEHGSDHRTIETRFETTTDGAHEQETILLKNAPWKEIRARIAANLKDAISGSVQERMDALVSVVLEAVHALTPKTRPSPYAKRWWTSDLTQLRRVYTYWRNRARAMRRAGCTDCDILDTAKAAAKQYHDAIRKQKKSHWETFLADHDNIWQAAKYLQSGKEAAFGKVPRLTRADGTRTSSNAEQAEEFLTAFFPPLPRRIDEENDRPQRNAVPMPDLTLEEVQRQLMAAKSWKAPGQDGLPMVVWQQVWPVVQDQILALFQTSLDEGVLPDKEDYGIAGAWRPISLLCTLGKVLESIIAERIFYAVETFGLLPTNHFGGRKQRSAEQALVLLQEQIYAAWRGGRVLTLVSFDVKVAYNGVFKDRLLQKMRARGMPEKMVRWIGAFCTQDALDQAGLPQGSPLSPVAYLFFNADLVQRRIDANGGAIAFIDDFTAWVTGPTAQSNLEGILSIVEHAEEWERRSGATFNAKKTAVMHFTRNARKANTTPIVIKRQSVEPREHTKILGVIMDARLKFQQHIPEATSKAMEAAMELKRLRGLSAKTARQLFAATVTPVVDYASNVWMHAYKDKLLGQIDRVQRAGAQAIVGTFMTVATSVAEAEAHIVSARERFWKRAIKMWVEVHTLPGTNPLSRITKRIKKFYTTFRSPLHQVAERLKGIRLWQMETVTPVLLEPWRACLKTVVDKPTDEVERRAKKS